ncbi:hypothetical protein KP509_04G040100 [Ceratopteris richardii]|nr:hypothetical protein KP509_04G040100 [Ceratopteris richardii]
MCYAEQIFQKLPQPDQSLWSTLILGYSRHREPWQVIDIFQKVQQTEVGYLSNHALMSLLTASMSLNDPLTGMTIHACAVRQGILEENPYIGSALVDMYAKCGQIHEARYVFGMLSVKDVVGWTSMIAGNVACGSPMEALHCFEVMQSEGIQPDSFSYASGLRACARLCDRVKGQEIYVEIVKKGLETTDGFLSSGLVDMYARCGLLLEACSIFLKQPFNVVAWTALLTRVTSFNCSHKIVCQLLDFMDLEGLCPSAVTFVCILKTCSAIGSIATGCKVHIEIVKRGFEGDAAANNSLIDFYVKCNFLEEAHYVFHKLSSRTVVSYNALLAGYALLSKNEQVLDVCKLMDLECVYPNAITFAISLQACGNMRAKCDGQQIYAEIMKRGFPLEGDDYIGNALIDMYMKCGLLEDAYAVFSKLPVQDVISWTLIIQGYSEYGSDEEAFEYFELMQKSGISPSVVTLAYSLRVCGDLGALAKGQEVHMQSIKRGLEEEPTLRNCVLYLYSKCGMLAAAEQLFHGMLSQDIVPWNILMAGYAVCGETKEVLQIFNNVIEQNLQPDSVTFVHILNACSHEGDLEKGQMLFYSMLSHYDINPSLNHYTCMIDLLGRSGNMNAANIIITEMPLHPGLVEWHTIMAACRKWGNVDLARHGFQHARQLDEMDDNAYLYMFNIYADALMHEAARRVNNLRGLN